MQSISPAYEYLKILRYKLFTILFHVDGFGDNKILEVIATFYITHTVYEEGCIKYLLTKLSMKYVLILETFKNLVRLIRLSVSWAARQVT